MSKIRLKSRTAALLATLPLALLLSGCAGDDIEFQGKIFDAVGIGGSGGPKSAEPKLAARAPIVLPPNLDRLPQPGEQPEAAAPDVAALADPDQASKVSRAELERQQAEYCKKNYELPKAHGDISADSAVGPLGPCRASVLTAIENWTKEE
jgi:hypothetical protein